MLWEQPSRLWPLFWVERNRCTPTLWTRLLLFRLLLQQELRATLRSEKKYGRRKTMFLGWSFAVSRVLHVCERSVDSMEENSAGALKNTLSLFCLVTFVFFYAKHRVMFLADHSRRNWHLRSGRPLGWIVRKKKKKEHSFVLTYV